MTRLVKWLAPFLEHVDLAHTRRVGLYAGLAMLTWGLILLQPFETFKAFGGIYSLMGQYAPENVWAIAFITAGASLFLGELYRYRPLILAGAIGVMVGRLFIAILTGIYSQWAATGVPDHALWAMMALVAFLGALRDEP